MLTNDGYQRLIMLAPAELDAILATFGGASRPSGECRRTSQRLAYRAEPLKVHIRQPNGDTGKFLCYPRDLTAGGIGLLHGGFVHPGTVVHVILHTVLEQPHTLPGKIAWCSHVSGRIHALGARFDKPIELRKFVDPSVHLAPPKTPAGNAEPGGAVLYVDPEPMDFELLKMQFGCSPLKLLYAKSCAEGVRKAMDGPLDAVLSELMLPDGDGADLMRGLREVGYLGGVIIVTREHDEDRLRRAGTLGAIRVLQKPYEPATLMRAVMGMVRQSRIPISSTPIYSMLDGMLANPEPLLRYAELLRRMRESIEEALTRADIERIKNCCQSIIASARRFGFPTIADAAGITLERVGESGSIRESRDSVLRLCLAIGRVSVRHRPGESDAA